MYKQMVRESVYYLVTDNWNFGSLNFDLFFGAGLCLSLLQRTIIEFQDFIQNTFVWIITRNIVLSCIKLINTEEQSPQLLIPFLDYV